MLNIPALSEKERVELKILLKYTCKLDEKRLAVQQLIEQGSVLLQNSFDVIAYPLFSGLIPAALLNLLNNEIKQKGLPFFEFSAPSSLTQVSYSKVEDQYSISTTGEGDLLVAKIAQDLSVFFESSHLNPKETNLLLIDANLGKGFTINFFIKALKILEFNFQNLTFVVTDNREEKVNPILISERLLNGGSFITLNKANKTNKVFDNVLTPSCNKRNEHVKKFVGTDVLFDYSQLTFIPYYLAIEIFKQEILKLRN